MTMTNLGEAVEKIGPLNIAERTCQTADASGNRLAVPQNIKHGVNTQQCHS